MHCCQWISAPTIWLSIQERLQRQAAELRRKLAGINPDGPSREERYYRRLQQIEDGEVPSRGKPLQTCILSSLTVFEQLLLSQVLTPLV
jgi:hypothetical protein